MIENVTTDDILQHYGVKGVKWGVVKSSKRRLGDGKKMRNVVG